MSNAEEPKAGQWWLSDEGKPVLIAFDERTIGSESSCPIIAYRKPDCGEWYAVNRFVRRLPDDAGFDWKSEPEIVFPQYCIPIAGGITTCHNKQVAFWTFDDNEHGRTFHTDGTSFPFASGNFKDDKKRAVTKDEAEARVVKPKSGYPQYWSANNPEFAYLRRNSNDTHVCVRLDGTETDWCDWHAIPHNGRVQLTKAEAEARIVKPAPIPEIVFDPKKFTSDWGPFEKPSPDRWFIWSDNRYPIAFVKHADGKVQNLNVDSILKQSDDWNHGYEDQLTNGELVEVTEFSAKAFLKRPRSASQIPTSSEPDPEELVTQDRVPARIGIDKGWWSAVEKAPAPHHSWFNVNRNHNGMMHRHKCDDDTVLNLCCRRADLPPLPESKPNRIPVRLYWYDGNVVARYGHTSPTDPSFVEIKLDPQMIISGSGFYVEQEDK